MKQLFIILQFLILPNLVYSTISIQSINYYTSITYDNDTGVEVSQKIKVNNQGTPGEFFITIDGGQYGTVHSRRVEDWEGKGTGYSIYKDQTNKVIIKDTSSATDNTEVLNGKFTKSSQKKSLTYYIGMDKNIYPTAGYFSDTIKVTLYSGTLSNYTLVQSINIQIAIQVQNDIALSIVPKDSSFDAAKTDLTIDFGELTSGLQREADIIVKSNLNYKIDLSSSNGGSLKLVNTWSDKEVPYSLKVNNSEVNLVPWQSVTVLQGGATGSTGNRARLLFTIQDFWDVSDGDYEDTIRVTISSN